MNEWRCKQRNATQINAMQHPPARLPVYQPAYPPAYRPCSPTCTVGMRGSFQPSTLPVSTNQVSLRLLNTVCTKFSLRQPDRSSAGPEGRQAGVARARQAGRPPG
jgi:hypothetical protein